MKRKNSSSLLPFVLLGVIAVVIIISMFFFFPNKEKHEEEETDTAVTETTASPSVEIEETRGVYVTTVYNLNFPSKADLSAEELKSELDAIVKNTCQAGLNTIYFQVRPSCDALYKSDIFPVSPYLSTDGSLPLDCLEYLTEEGHKNGIAVYAWINPLRVTVSKSTLEALPESSPAKELSDHVVDYNGKLYFDPASKEVRDLICRGIKEICDNYSIDGVVFDDYFYPYKEYITSADGTKEVVSFDDSEAFAASGNEFLSLDDFRRNNVNLLVEAVYKTVKESNEHCLFGVAPFGIWKNGTGGADGSLTGGMESYSEIYCDSLAWVKGGYIDFLAPQIYWDMDSLAASFKVLSKWWDARITESGNDVSLLISHAVYRYEDGFESGEITKQLDYASSLENYKGSVFYSYSSICNNTNGVTDEITAYYTKTDNTEVTK